METFKSLKENPCFTSSCLLKLFKTYQGFKANFEVEICFVKVSQNI